MILTAHQPSYLPWLGLFAKIAQADTFVLFDDVQYCPKDFQNRNKIWTSHGPHWLTVPVMHMRHDKIKDVEINNVLPWQRKHWKSIEQSYHKAHYWDRYQYFLHDFITMQWTHLSALCGQLTMSLLHDLNLKPQVLLASNYHFQGTKSDLVLDMCKQLGASTYIFGSEGKGYAEIEKFEAAGIAVKFQDYHHPTYTQFGGEFMSHLSIIDLLFHHGPAAQEILLS